MSFKCKIFGHKWNVYKEDIQYMIPATSNSHMSIPGFTVMYKKDFRICSRCYYKQIRDHYTGREKTDWCEYVLCTEELRDKKLKELGI
jgi:hypothetical protein